jgi:hypothetical protein
VLPLALAALGVARDVRRWPSWAVAWAALRASEEASGPCGARALALTEELVGREVAQVPVISEAYERLADCAAARGDPTAARTWMEAYGRWAAGNSTLEQRARVAAAAQLLRDGGPGAAEDAAFGALAGARSVTEQLQALRSLEAALIRRQAVEPETSRRYEPEDPAGPAGCFRVPAASPCTLDAAVAALLEARATATATQHRRLVQRALALGLLELPEGGQLLQDTPAELYALGEWTLADRLLTETNPTPSPAARWRQVELALGWMKQGGSPEAAMALLRREGGVRH